MMMMINIYKERNIKIYHIKDENKTNKDFHVEKNTSSHPQIQPLSRTAK